MASQYSFDDITSNYGEDWQNNSHPGRRSDVPSVRVSAVAEPPQPSPSGRTRSQLPPGHANFSRPVPPPLPPEEQKRQVLMRNANSSHSSLVRTDAPRPPPAQQPGRSSPSAPHPPAMALPRPNSQNSVYSSYSYYPYDAALPSPSPSQNATHSNTHLSPMPAPAIAIHPPSPSQARDAPPSPAGGSLTNPQTAQDFLQLGIQHHLANELSESAACFEKSATLGGGCGMGMLMWGLTQRHGWGCPQSEARGFKWLRRAAELAVNDLESAKAGMDSMDKSAVKVRRLRMHYSDCGSRVHAVGAGACDLRGWPELLPRVGRRQGQEDGCRECRAALPTACRSRSSRRAISAWRPTSATPTHSRTSRSASRTAKAARKTGRRPQSGTERRYVFFILISMLELIAAQVAQGVSDIGLAWIYKEKFQ